MDDLAARFEERPKEGNPEWDREARHAGRDFPPSSPANISFDRGVESRRDRRTAIGDAICRQRLSVQSLATLTDFADTLQTSGMSGIGLEYHATRGERYARIGFAGQAKRSARRD